MTLDWRKICKAYMKQVIQAEGISYLSVPFGKGALETDLDEDERQGLQKLESELENRDKANDPVF